jgi:hypothetical protein
MGVEKTTSTTRFSRAVGTVFLLVGILFVISARAQE